MAGVQTALHIGPGPQVLNVTYINIPEGVDVIVVFVLRLGDLGPVRSEFSDDVLSEDRAECGTVLVNRAALSVIDVPGFISPQKNITPVIHHREPDRFDRPYFLGYGSKLVATYLEPVLLERVIDYGFPGESGRSKWACCCGCVGYPCLVLGPDRAVIGDSFS